MAKAIKASAKKKVLKRAVVKDLPSKGNVKGGMKKVDKTSPQ